MPSRVIRGEILSSRSLARVSRDAANLFIRLTLAVDEYGRMDGRWRVIHSETYGDRDDTTVEQVRAWVEELCAEGCADRYDAGRDPVLRLPSTETHRAKRNRADASKYPCRCGTYTECSCPPQSSASSCGEKRGEISSDASGSGGLGVIGFGSGSSCPESAEAAAPASDEPDEAFPEPEPLQPPEAVDFAEAFRSALAAAHSGLKAPTPSAFSKWVNEARLMLQRDQRPLAEVQALADWLFNSPSAEAQFWRPNVLSVPKFREKFDQLQAQRRRSTHGPIRTASAGPLEQAARRIAADIQRRSG
jgi:hypothetical protein